MTEERNKEKEVQRVKERVEELEPDIEERNGYNMVRWI